LAGSTTKKAVLHRYEKEPLAGYVNPITYLQPGGVELLSAQGNVVTVPYFDIRSISFVRDWEETGDAERRVFHTRPKTEGLWVRFEFRDGQVMEGIMTNNLLQMEHYGFTAIPPDRSGTNQRVFIPRVSLRSVNVLGVIGSPLRKRKAKPASREQIDLFEE
jgi:hypothetical protein